MDTKLQKELSGRQKGLKINRRSSPRFSTPTNKKAGGKERGKKGRQEIEREREKKGVEWCDKERDKTKKRRPPKK
jgi:hypothetical protein